MTAEIIAKALGGHRAGATWMASCPVHDDRAPSLSISSGKDGKVLVRCHAGCEQRDVIAALIDRGLWDATGKSAGRFAHKRRTRISAEPDPDENARTAAALAIWQASQAVEGTPVATYLRSRGLDLPTSPALRFHAGLKHPSGGVWPAMVGLVTHGVTGSPIAVHRTFLAYAQRLFAAQEPREKRRLLNFLLSNCTWEDGEVVATFREPFDMLAETAANSNRLESGVTLKAAKNEIWLGN